MVWSFFRVAFGFLVAVLVAGFVQVAFVITPADLIKLDQAAALERLQGAGLLALLAATQSAVFAAPFALLASGIGEWWRVRSVLYYAAAGVAIAGTGFLAQSAGERGGGIVAPTIVNQYALTAFLTAGLAAGLMYWVAAGRGAGGRHAEKTPREQRTAAATS